MEIGTNIRTIRKNKGITIKKLADITGIPYRTLQDYESGKIKEPSHSKLAIIAKKLEVPLSEITGEDRFIFHEMSLAQKFRDLEYVQKEIAQLTSNLNAVEKKILEETDPTISKELLYESYEIYRSLDELEPLSEKYEKEFSELLEFLNISKERFYNEQQEFQKLLYNTNLLRSIRNNINTVIEDSPLSDRIDFQLNDENLSYLQKLFSKDDLMFFDEAFLFIANMKAMFSNILLLPKPREVFISQFIDFFTSEYIGLPERIVADTLSKIFEEN